MPTWVAAKRCHRASPQNISGLSASSTVACAAHNRQMLDAVVNAPPIANLLALLGSAGAVLGGVVGWFFEATSWRRAFENLALGATVGTVCFSAAAFLSYALIRFFGW